MAMDHKAAELEPTLAIKDDSLNEDRDLPPGIIRRYGNTKKHVRFYQSAKTKFIFTLVEDEWKKAKAQGYDLKVNDYLMNMLRDGITYRNLKQQTGTAGVIPAFNRYMFDKFAGYSVAEALNRSMITDEQVTQMYVSCQEFMREVTADRALFERVTRIMGQKGY